MVPSVSQPGRLGTFYEYRASWPCPLNSSWVTLKGDLGMNLVADRCKTVLSMASTSEKSPLLAADNRQVACSKGRSTYYSLKATVTLPLGSTEIMRCDGCLHEAGLSEYNIENIVYTIQNIAQNSHMLKSEEIKENENRKEINRPQIPETHDYW